MRLDTEAENERESSPEVAEKLSVLMDVFGGPTLARTMQTAMRLGFFEALAERPMTAVDLARHLETGPRATTAVLDVLATTDYVTRVDGVYALTELGRTSVLGLGIEGGMGFVNFLVIGRLEWKWHGHLEHFVRTDEAVDIHTTMTAEEWQIYETDFLAANKPMEPMMVEHARLPKGARSLLDIGGGHGFVSTVLCRAYPDLRAVVLDLPGAIAAAGPLLASESKDLDGRVVLRAGDALTMDLGVAEYDVVLLWSIVHLLTRAQNLDLVKRAARALRPGGHLVITDAFANPHPSRDGETMGCLHLLMGLICASGLWTVDELMSWPREAGLVTTPGDQLTSIGGAIYATKPL